jgi:hypothetical protein
MGSSTRRRFIAGSAATMTTGSVRAQAAWSSEHRYWADKAALLDPAAYEYVSGAGWSRTVPEGETWHAVNVWRVIVAGTERHRWFHRKADADAAMPLPAGHTLATDPDTYALAWYARPGLVQHDPRYHADPRALYFDRLAQLDRLPLQALSVHRPQGTPVDDPVETKKRVEFPADFERGLIRHYSVHDGCWLCLVPETGFERVSNVLDELDDIRPLRFTSKVNMPFLRSIFPAIFLGHGSLEGTVAAPGPTTYEGWGAVHYVKLPPDW